MIIKRIQFDPEFEPVHIPVVIEHEIFDGVEKSARIIARARKEAARIRKSTREVLAQTVVEKEEERKRGYEEGRQEALGQVAEKLITLEAQRQKIHDEAEPQIVRMVMDIAEKVIGREIASGAMVDVVKKTMGQAVGHKLVCRINPADVAVIREREPEVLAALEPLQSISMKEDESIPQGGCIIESEVGTVDARLETQLGAIRKALNL